MTYKCPTCQKENPFVNHCGCDPNNLPTKVPNLKFWVWHQGCTLPDSDIPGSGDGPVRLKLKPGQFLYTYRWSRDEEGSSSEMHRWTHAGDHVVEAIACTGHDCDGRLDRGGVYTCDRANLAAGNCPSDPAVVYPQWEVFSTSQRDHTAEAMNY
jgi:hypothetical protein